MNIKADYCEILEKQCSEIRNIILNRKSDFSGSVYYSEICKRLTKDFLPPIEREDIALISYSLLEIGRNALNIKTDGGVFETGIKEQAEMLSETVKGLFQKNKACGDDIRRFVNINFECGKSCSRSAEKLNYSFRDFILAVQTAYFKNL